MKLFLGLLALTLLVTATTDDTKFLENQSEKTEEAPKSEETVKTLPLMKGFEDIMKHVRNPWKGRTVSSFECAKEGGKDCLPQVRPPHSGGNRPGPPTKDSTNP